MLIAHCSQLFPLNRGTEGVSGGLRGSHKNFTYMKILGNIIWWICGGLEAAFAYFAGSLVLFCTIIGIPVALQTFKLGLLCLWPFGSTVKDSESSLGCLAIPLNLIWIVFGGFWAFLCHVVFGILLCITIIGIPFGRQHFKMAGLSLMPFGKEVVLKF